MQKVFPILEAECSTADLVPFILPNIFAIAEQTNEAEFGATILPALVPVLKMQRPFQVCSIVVEIPALFEESVVTGSISSAAKHGTSSEQNRGIRDKGPLPPFDIQRFGFGHCQNTSTNHSENEVDRY